MHAFTKSVEHFRLGGDRPHEAAACEALGDAHAAAGDAERARDAWRRSVSVRTEAGLPAGLVRAKLQAERQ